MKSRDDHGSVICPARTNGGHRGTDMINFTRHSCLLTQVIYLLIKDTAPETCYK
jgi:hypothetical protein